MEPVMSAFAEQGPAGGCTPAGRSSSWPSSWWTVRNSARELDAHLEPKVVDVIDVHALGVEDHLAVARSHEYLERSQKVAGRGRTQGGAETAPPSAPCWSGETPLGEERREVHPCRVDGGNQEREPPLPRLRPHVPEQARRDRAAGWYWSPPTPSSRA